MDIILNRQHKVWATAFTNWPAGRSTALATLSTYKSGIDQPIQILYKELLAEFPDAKVLLTVRDFDSWYTSVLATIWKVDLLLRGAPAYVAALCPDVKYWIAMHDAYFAPSGLFQGRIHDKEHMRKVFEGWNAEVQRVVPPDRLLVFNAKSQPDEITAWPEPLPVLLFCACALQVRQGWAPLCAFLGVPVPDDKPFPNVNDSAEFQQVSLSSWQPGSTLQQPHQPCPARDVPANPAPSLEPASVAADPREDTPRIDIVELGHPRCWHGAVGVRGVCSPQAALSTVG
ncbi:hypothetical protein QJQ45_021597 [Haematococcus lacustris]|nr:hypothetical protein QJQ45_021597 [Haematococcus lacustris]